MADTMRKQPMKAVWGAPCHVSNSGGCSMTSSNPPPHDDEGSIPRMLQQMESLTMSSAALTSNHCGLEQA